MDRVKELEQAIELKRDELNQAGNRYGLLSEIVLRLSGELDDLLNKYRKMNRAAT
ncbi:aspartyl-phosphate phosphatase Spo0E family protein [Paenibacillus puerhi]|uniref:aspartyl-phosphate phosphatase Spo0E family protein n=1 Tax=Paenibacillus puerhi TaxID=2692622 RepID=UPI001F3D1074|nr:aspartyl-phosphate phosphatase Spo0E family protein [Paenibacillus puerhi]